MGACPLKSSNRFTPNSPYPIELKLGRMILHISPHSRSESDFMIFSQKARLLKSSNRFTAHSSYTIELKLGSMILDTSSHNRSRPDFSISSHGRCWVAPLEIFKSIPSLQF